MSSLATLLGPPIIDLKRLLGHLGDRPAQRPDAERGRKLVQLVDLGDRLGKVPSLRARRNTSV